MTKQTIQVSPQLISEIGQKIIADIVANPAWGTAEAKAMAFLSVIAEKCSHCQSDTHGKSNVNRIAQCSDEKCPLYGFGTSVYRGIWAEVDSRSDIGVELQ